MSIQRAVEITHRQIKVERQLQQSKLEGFYITRTKTEAGKRILPMSDEVYEVCKHIVETRPSPKCEPMVDGHTGFLFLNSQERPMTGQNLAKHMQMICQKHNSIYKTELPPISPHVCRHTFCTNMAKKGMYPKMLQYLMGHSELDVTMNVYTHVTAEDAEKEYRRVLSFDEYKDKLASQG